MPHAACRTVKIAFVDKEFSLMYQGLPISWEKLFPFIQGNFTLCIRLNILLSLIKRGIFLNFLTVRGGFGLADGTAALSQHPPVPGIVSYYIVLSLI